MDIWDELEIQRSYGEDFMMGVAVGVGFTEEERVTFDAVLTLCEFLSRCQIDEAEEQRDIQEGDDP